MLGLVDDEESADAAKAIVVKVLDNDTVTVEGQAPESVEEALGEGEFDLSVDTAPEHGTAKVDGSTIVYTSARGYGGEDEFTYRLATKGSKGAKGEAGAKPGPSGTAVVRITVTEPPPPPAPKPVKTKKPVPPPVSYANCAAVKAAGAAPIRIGEPGYGRHLDRDGDGIGCEWSSGSSSGSGGSSTTSGGSDGGGSGSTYYQNCTAVRAAGAAPIRSGDPGYGRHLDRDGDGVACE